MTALATIADQSDATLWPTWVLIVTAIPIIAAVVSVLSLVFRPHGVPVMGDELSNLDNLDRPHKTGCAVPTCNTNPTVHVYASREWWTFCIEHGTPYLTEEMSS